MRRHAPLLALALAVAACDTPASEVDVEFQGVDLVTRGDARLELVDDGAALVVSGLDGSRSGGFTVEGLPTRVDVETDPLAVPPGGRFGIVVEGAGGGLLASFYATGTQDGALDFLFDFGGSVPITEVVIRYFQGGENGELVFEGRLDWSQGRRAAQVVATSAGLGEGTTGSTHVIRRNGKYVVVTDSDTSVLRSARCAGFSVLPPPVFEAQEPFCTDWIEVDPVRATDEEVERGTVSVLARGVGSFTVRQLRAIGG